MAAKGFAKRLLGNLRSHHEHSLYDPPTELTPESDPVPTVEGDIAKLDNPSVLFQKRVPVSTSIKGAAAHKYWDPPTDRIRLLRLKKSEEEVDPSNEDEDVRPTHWYMQTYPIERLKLDDRRYWALSYTWGKPSKSTKSTKFYTYINNEKIEVSENLWMALRALSKARFGEESLTGTIRYLWVDALCINQANISERNIQVSMMDRIYAGACFVTAWLGPANTHSEILFKHLTEADRINKDKDILATLFPPPGQTNTLSEPKELPIEELKDIIKDIASRPYWSRAWIRQELHFAKQVVFLCGEDLIHAQPFSRLLDKLPSSYLREHSDISAVARLVRSAMNYESWKVNLSLADLLDTYGQGQCTMKHDRIYSLLPMAKDSPQAKGYRVDYSLSYEEVVVKAVAFCECPTSSRRHALFSILGDDFSKNHGFTVPTSKLLAYAEYLRAQHEQGKTWPEIMSIPYKKIQHDAPVEKHMNVALAE